MLKRLYWVPVLLALALLAGCRGNSTGSSYGASSSPASASGSTAAASTAQSTSAPPAQTYQPTRNSTTQPLPPGYGYINEKELASARK